jgi:8-oxo-dGTP diphosphatase
VRIEDFQVKASSWADDISWISMNNLPTLAFDHNHILENTYEMLKQKLQNEPVCFDLLPERFTLSDFQQLYEYAFSQEMDKANFRKKIKSIPLIALNEKQKNVKHRPAKLFSFDGQTYKELKKDVGYSFKM